MSEYHHDVSEKNLFWNDPLVSAVIEEEPEITGADRVLSVNFFTSEPILDALVHRYLVKEKQ